MSARHTPGPWEWSANHSLRPTNPSPIFCSILEVENWGMVYRGSEIAAMDAEIEANRRLIAAAPDLLALAKQHAAECGECNGTGRACMGLAEESCADCADIRAVIAKATGEGRS